MSKQRLIEQDKFRFYAELLHLESTIEELIDSLDTYNEIQGAPEGPLKFKVAVNELLSLLDGDFWKMLNKECEGNSKKIRERFVHRDSEVILGTHGLYRKIRGEFKKAFVNYSRYGWFGDLPKTAELLLGICSCDIKEVERYPEIQEYINETSQTTLGYKGDATTITHGQPFCTEVQTAQTGQECKSDTALSNIADGQVIEGEDETTEGEKQAQANEAIGELVKEITAAARGLTKEQIAEMVIEAMRPEHKNNQENEGPDVGNRDCFWWLLRQKGCTQQPTQTIWNGLHFTLKERLGDNKDVTNLKNNYINTRVKAHGRKLGKTSGA